ncbi:MAG: chromate resistance protein [Gemmatimonadota bacterium]
MLVYLPAARMGDRAGREGFVVATFVAFSLFPLAVASAHSFATLLLAFVVGGLREIGEPSRKALIDLALPHARARSVRLYYLVRSVAIARPSSAGSSGRAPVATFVAAALVGFAGAGGLRAHCRRAPGMSDRHGSSCYIRSRPRRSCLRVKVWRRMQQIGAVALKNAAWVLPADDAAREDFEWLMREIEADGGGALQCDSRLLPGLSPEQVAALAQVREPEDTPNGEDWPGGGTDTGKGDSTHGEDFSHLVGRTWVTRRGVHVDRIASAWLIRRFVDPDARFRFVDPDGYEPAPGELRFDMYEGEYTHAGDSCTCEVLASTFAPGDAALAALAQVVHDIDLKEGRFGRPEAPGVELLLEGLVASEPDDDARLQRGFVLFADLYTALKSRLKRGTR